MQTRKEQLISKLYWVCDKLGLSFDGPGTHNFRKLPKRDVWNIYFRSRTVKGSPALRQIWLKEGTELVDLLKKVGFETVQVEGGCADFGCSMRIGW